jgi:acetoin utilization deacetylase AcuC-like enzyme
MVQHVPPRAAFSEKPDRIVGIEGRLKGYSFQEACSGDVWDMPARPGSVWKSCKNVLVNEPLSREEIVAEYGEAEVSRWIAALPQEGENPKWDTKNGDIYWSSGSLYAAGIAANAAVQATRDVLQGLNQTAFCIVRPPGHHCFQTPEGFCILNNVVLAAKEALSQGKKVAIVDWDYHFGDGTAKAFLRNEDVMFVSLHAKYSRYGDETYPRNTWDNLKGSGLCKKTQGRMFNVLWVLDDADDSAYTYAFQKVILPALQTFNPDIVFISAGFDAVKGDALAGMYVSPKQFAYMSACIADLGVPTIAVLEGGYDPELLAECTEFTIKGLRDQNCMNYGSIESLNPMHAQVVDSVHADLVSMNCIRP